MRYARATAWRCFDCKRAEKLEHHHLIYGVGAAMVDLCPRCHGARHGRYNQYGKGELKPWEVPEGGGNVLIGLVDEASGALYMSWRQLDRVIFNNLLHASTLNHQIQNEIDILVDTVLKASKAAGVHFNACAYVQGHNTRLYNFGTAIVPVLTEVLKKVFNSPAYMSHEPLFNIALAQFRWVAEKLNASLVQHVPQASALAKATQTSIASALALMARGCEDAEGLYGALEWLIRFGRGVNPHRLHQRLGVKAAAMFGKAVHTKWVMGDRAGRIEVAARPAAEWAAAFKELDLEKLLAD